MNCSAGKISTVPPRRAHAIGLSAPPVGCVLDLIGLPGAGNKICDRSPYGNIGTITGAVWKRLASGLWVLDFDGGDDFVNCGNSLSLDAIGAITITAWIKPGVDFTTGTFYQIVDKRNGGIAPTLLWHGTSHLTFYAGTSAAVGATTSLTGGVWYHIAGTLIDGTNNGKIFINGQDDTTSTDTATFVTNTANLQIGRVVGDGNWFNGGIALLRMYNRALSALEINNHFKREKHLFGVV